METVYPLLKSPCVAAQHSAPFCMLMYRKETVTVAAPYVSLQLARSRTDEQERWQDVYLFFHSFSLPPIGEHSNTELAVLANDLPTALSFLLI